MRRIIIDVYDHTTDDEVEDVLAALKRVGVGPRLETVPDSHVAPLTPAQIQASEKVWLAKRVEKPVLLRADQAAALWSRIQADSIAARAFTGPR
jgi:hypothetical protein